jgi:hypothetical protein
MGKRSEERKQASQKLKDTNNPLLACLGNVVII